MTFVTADFSGTRQWFYELHETSLSWSFLIVSGCPFLCGGSFVVVYPPPLGVLWHIRVSSDQPDFQPEPLAVSGCANIKSSFRPLWISTRTTRPGFQSDYTLHAITMLSVHVVLLHSVSWRWTGLRNCWHRFGHKVDTHEYGNWNGEPHCALRDCHFKANPNMNPLSLPKARIKTPKDSYGRWMLICMRI